MNLFEVAKNKKIKHLNSNMAAASAIKFSSLEKKICFIYILKNDIAQESL
ncbi:hypothetical protein SAMN04487931_102320 [Desulfobacula phenolica]|uniref:Uncharacterized protein n=1 Tax=Desulfobacula phenolica TaxID=90732 RepID=A0A1H2DY50_9BACT|nr:hypothetical protein SAMN04487931_102320 [Desulfobacula phenolica]